jgi:predicted N-formylglutamate amidohydrolase
MHLLLTCEHYGNNVPTAYKKLFTSNEKILHTHRGFDIGADSLWESFCPYAKYAYKHPYTRLLIDLNRPLDSAHLFSKFTKHCGSECKTALISRYHAPYWEQVLNAISTSVYAKQTILHISLHTFTPEFHKKRRSTDIGILFDPHRNEERLFADLWRTNILHKNCDLAVHFNRPYRGNTPCLTSSARTLFPHGYIGVELEVNQRFVQQMPAIGQQICSAAIQSLKESERLINSLDSADDSLHLSHML